MKGWEVHPGVIVFQWSVGLLQGGGGINRCVSCFNWHGGFLNRCKYQLQWSGFYMLTRCEASLCINYSPQHDNMQQYRTEQTYQQG